MFFIVPENKEDLVEALGILAYYHVAASSYIEDPDDLDTMYLAVNQDHFTGPDADNESDVRLAEAAFQMNWHQGGKCPECSEDDISLCVDCDIRYACDDSRDDCALKHHKRLITCGHLVFTKPINPAF